MKNLHLHLDLPPRRYPINKADVYGPQYGAFDVSQEYIGLSSRARRAWGTWQHGWAHELENIDPEWIIGTNGCQLDKFSSHHMLWVFRKDQEEFLNKHGVQNVRAIGAPILYANILAERISKSLLIMPPHGTMDTSFPLRKECYLDWVEKLLGDFEFVAACIGYDDYKRGDWVKDFRRLGIPCIEGACVSDYNSLRRMAYIFQKFDYMTTPDKGSHIAYASYFGCKVSVTGPRLISERVLRTSLPAGEFYRNYPKGVDIASELSSQGNMQKMLGHFMIEPLDSVAMVDWGKKQLGEDCKLSPKELKKELGWSSKQLIMNYARFNCSRIVNKIL